MNDCAEIEKEVVEALEASGDPMGRHDLFHRCPAAISADQISHALNRLAKRGMVQQMGFGKWGLTGDYDAPAPQPSQTAIKVAVLNRLALIVSDDIREVLREIIKDVEAA